ncbi:hypothetical protein BKA93DRAFT_791311 [Sparassis latifolia]
MDDHVLRVRVAEVSPFHSKYCRPTSKSASRARISPRSAGIRLYLRPKSPYPKHYAGPLYMIGKYSLRVHAGAHTRAALRPCEQSRGGALELSSLSIANRCQQFNVMSFFGLSEFWARWLLSFTIYFAPLRGGGDSGGRTLCRRRELILPASMDALQLLQYCLY